MFACATSFLQIPGFGLVEDDPCLPVNELDDGTSAGLASGGVILVGACGGGFNKEQ